MQSDASAIQATRCTFSRNSATFGGAIESFASTIRLAGCQAVGNSAEFGGAIDNVHGSSLSLANSAFVGNAARWGGAITSHFESTLHAANTTFCNNAADHGGALDMLESEADIANCILWGNASADGSQVHAIDSDLAVSWTDIQGGFAGEGNIDVDPAFVRPASPGADGAWGTGDDDAGDLRLRPSSGAVDAGSNELVPADAHDLDGDGDLTEPAPLDLGGASRFADVGSAPDTGHGSRPIVDLGAFETIAPAKEISIRGGAGDDVFSLRLSDDGASLEIRSGVDADADPISVHPFAAVQACSFELEDGADSLWIDFANGNPVPPGGLHVNGGEGADELLLLHLHDPAAALVIRPEASTFSGRAVAHAGIEATALGGDDDVLVGQLSIEGDARLSLASGGRTLRPGSLFVAPGASLDLGNNRMIIETTSEALEDLLADVREWVATARNTSPHWHGAGITSSYARENPLGLTTLAVTGCEASPEGGAGQVVVQPARYGDCDLSGTVDGQDYLLLDRDFLSARVGLLPTDLTCDGRIDGDDYFLIDAAFLSPPAARLPADDPFRQSISEGAGQKDGAGATMPLLRPLGGDAALVGAAATVGQDTLHSRRPMFPSAPGRGARRPGATLLEPADDALALDGRPVA